jgi:hypothetical protein
MASAAFGVRVVPVEDHAPRVAPAAGVSIE